MLREGANEYMNDNKNRSNFSNRLGFVMAAAGSAVGLGNIWRFLI